MSRRNPIRGRRRKPKPGDRVVYELPAGPPAEALAAYEGDVQAAITAGLSLLALAMRGQGGVSVGVPTGGQAPEPRSVDSPSQVDEVLDQDFFAT